MILPDFKYHAPESLNEAVEWLAVNHFKGVGILAGGTDLLVMMRGRAIPFGHMPTKHSYDSNIWKAKPALRYTPNWVMSITRIPGLKEIKVENNQLRIGPLVTHNQLEQSPLIQQHAQGLAESAAILGSPLCRNRGTYGGNLCNARPASDTTIPTLALGGKLKLLSVRGERIVDHVDFVTAPGKTIIEPDEILVEIYFDLPENPRFSSYIKLGNRKALDIAVVGVAAAVEMNGSEIIRNSSIALASVAPKPIRIDKASQAINGKELNSETAQVAARIARDEIKPIDDQRGSAQYRYRMVEELVERALMNCLDRKCSREVTV